MSKKLLFIFILLLSFSLFASPCQALSSLKKGYGDSMVNHCNGSSNPDDCWLKVRNLASQLGATWYYNWFIQHAHRQRMGDIEYVPMVWGEGGNPDGSYTPDEIANFQTYARNNRGSYWLIWNEPDFYQQANFTPEYGAKIYKQLRNAIKDQYKGDPTAKLIIGGMLDHQNWNNWAQRFVNTYHTLYPNERLEYEGWHVHLYSCAYNRDSWRRYLTTFRSWIDNNGGGELWLTEFGCLSGDAPQIIVDNFDWMETYPGIQRYAWFVGWSTAAGSTFAGGNLFSGSYGGNPPLSLSPLGKVFAQYPTSIAPTSLPYPSATPDMCSRGNLGNLDCDPSGLINETDLNLLLASWTTTGPVPSPAPNYRSADIGGLGNIPDNKVDAFDLNKLLRSYR